MKSKKKRNIIIVLTLVLSLIGATFASSFAVSQEEYDAAQDEAKKAKAATEEKRKEAKEAAKKAAQAVKNFEQAEKELDRISAEIEDTKVAIANKEAEIETTRAAMDAKEKEIEDQQDALDSRLTAMYKTGNTGFIDVILNSQSVEDLMANVGMVQKILESDQALVKKLEKDYKELKKLKKDLEAQEAALVEQQIALEAKETETEELKKKYKAEADKMHKLEKQLEEEANALAAEALKKQLEAEKMIVEAGGDVNTAPGEYAWPTQSNWEISSKYGWRICPFHGREFHNGLDVVLTSGTQGSPVYAIADGYVTRASWYGGYGNCITYACGNGITVLCGHLSGYNCKKGQFVTKGSVIGYIGNTGNSTGPHLHFTVFQNGSHINPFSLY